MSNDVFTEETRLAVVRVYEEWHAARTVLYAKENDGKPVDSGDWAGSDDSGIEMLHDLITKLVKIDECGHKTAEATEQQDGTWLVECEHCPLKWSVKDGQGSTVS